MRLLVTLSVLLFNLISFTAASSSSSTADIFYWPVSSDRPSLLARVSYDPTTLESSVLSYTPPEATQDGLDDLVRIGFFTSTPEKAQQWVGALSSWSSLLSSQASAPEDKKSIPALRLHLGPADELYHVALSSASSSKSASDESQLGVEIVRPDVGPRPQLNRPIVVSPDGTGPEEVPEKTFFQK